MKKVIFGSAMLLAGLVSAALLLAGALTLEWNNNGVFSALWNISQYGLTPALCVFIAVAAVGIITALWGVFEKKK